MKIIELLNRIAKGEEVPKEIMFDTDRYYLNNNNHYVRECGNFIQRLDIEYNLVGCLNDEVEIIDEEKEIKVINKRYDDELEEYVAETYVNDTYYKEVFNSRYDEMIINKINEIIDLINDMRDKEC